MQAQEPSPNHKRLLIPWIAITSTLTLLLLVAHELGY